jgi:hypothetical protein
MARTDTLPHFLTDVADAIRTKKGTSELIQASTFDTEINNIPTGGDLQTKNVTITQNGETIVTPDDNYDGMDKVIITTNIHYTYLDLPFIYAPQYAYIGTNIRASNDIEVEMKFSASDVSNKALFGTTAGPNYYHVTLYNSAYYWGLNNGEGHGGSIVANINNSHTIIFNNANSNVIVDNSNIGSCENTTSSANLDLFRRRASSTGSTYHYLLGRVYYVIIRNRNTREELMNLWPKIRLSDGAVGFYDTVNNTFYKSSGSSNFIYQQ